MKRLFQYRIVELIDKGQEKVEFVVIDWWKGLTLAYAIPRVMELRRAGKYVDIQSAWEHNGKEIWKVDVTVARIDFVVDGIGYGQDSDADCFKWNLKELSKRRISDNTYDKAWQQYQAAKEGKKIMKYKDAIVDGIVRNIVDRIGCNESEAMTLFWNALEFNVVREEIYNQIQYMKEEYTEELYEPEDEVYVKLDEPKGWTEVETAVGGEE